MIESRMIKRIQQIKTYPSHTDNLQENLVYMNLSERKNVTGAYIIQTH